MYRVVPDDELNAQVEALPNELLDYYAQLLDLLELTPWISEPYNDAKPDGGMRRLGSARPTASRRRSSPAQSRPVGRDHPRCVDPLATQIAATHDITGHGTGPVTTGPAHLRPNPVPDEVLDCLEHHCDATAAASNHAAD